MAKAFAEYSTVRVVTLADGDRWITGEPPAVGDVGTVVAVHETADRIGYTVEESGLSPRWIADFDHDELELVSDPSGATP